MHDAAGRSPDGLDGPPSRDDLDVPATVFCTVCGSVDCTGCEKATPRVEGATPWEDGRGPAVVRLWKTAQITTLQGEAFFGALPEGRIGAALTFAVACELFAISSLLVLWLPLAYACVPELAEALATDPDRRVPFFAALALAGPALSVVMVGLHVVWGFALELGLGLSGTKTRLAHALRYSLYACGWDLVTSPFGFAAGWASSGFAGATNELQAALRVPRFATRAYLDRGRLVPANSARRALATAAVLTGGVVLAGAIGLGVAIVVALA